MQCMLEYFHKIKHEHRNHFMVGIKFSVNLQTQLEDRTFFF